MNQKLLINNLIKVEDGNRQLLRNIFLILAGTLFLALAAQISIPLPYVPITGQTFAVMLIGLVYGKKLGSATLLSYIAAGSLGAPVFAGFKSGLPTAYPSGGFIIGFFFAALICGYFADRGWTKSPLKLMVTLLAAHFVLYVFGLLQLSIFLPEKDIIKIGLLPFISGDIVKMLVLSALLPTVWKFTEKSF